MFIISLSYFFSALLGRSEAYVHLILIELVRCICFHKPLPFFPKLSYNCDLLFLAVIFLSCREMYQRSLPNSKIILNKTVAVIWPHFCWAFSLPKGSCSLSLDFLVIDSVRLTFSSNKVWPMTSLYLQWLRFGFWVFWGQVFFL